ncbi:outer membrane protein assembly factor BamB family protein [Sneathiella aquimaris]|uniref:outer membrane protein assembly factor BamB family protein n=1 Tax=Sneathiella aquimaris TaxID=2599305 RepID=UPI00146ED5C5|nr:PQQ-binding-like beta-propeller repeat protein [Sneathiella aquimaris]
MKLHVRYMGKIALFACSAALLTGCSLLPDWLGEAEAPPLPGERISILALEQSLEPDEGVADVTVRLPAPYVNANWPQNGGTASNVMHHLTLGDDLKEVWRANIGEGSDDESRLPSTPIVAEGTVYVMDSESRVRAFSQETGEKLWAVNLTPPEEEDGVVGGGLAAEYGRLFATTSYGEVFSLDPKSGGMYWKASIGAPLRAAPTAAEDLLFVTTYDNRIFALNVLTGETEWSYEGGVETTGLLGAASPAVEKGTVVVPFSSGELFALRANNGAQAWSDQLKRKRRLSSLTSLADINAFPVIDRGMIFAASYSGQMVGIDLRTGNRKWSQEISTLQTPWVAGDFVYVISTDGELVCLSRKNGLIRWVRSLGKFEDPEEKTGLIVWSGPVLASDRLILVSNYGIAVSVSPYDGKILGKVELSDTASLAPVVAGGMLFVLTDDAQLVAYR